MDDARRARPPERPACIPKLRFASPRTLESRLIPVSSATSIGRFRSASGRELAIGVPIRDEPVDAWNPSPALRSQAPIAAAPRRPDRPESSLSWNDARRSSTVRAASPPGLAPRNPAGSARSRPPRASIQWVPDASRIVKPIGFEVFFAFSQCIRRAGRVNRSERAEIPVNPCFITISPFRWEHLGPETCNRPSDCPESGTAGRSPARLPVSDGSPARSSRFRRGATANSGGSQARRSARVRTLRVPDGSKRCGRPLPAACAAMRCRRRARRIRVGRRLPTRDGHPGPRNQRGRDSA